MVLNILNIYLRIGGNYCIVINVSSKHNNKSQPVKIMTHGQHLSRKKAISNNDSDSDSEYNNFESDGDMLSE